MENNREKRDGKYQREKEMENNREKRWKITERKTMENYREKRDGK